MKDKKQQPTYYAIIPAPIRYNKELPAGAKLMYGEITALSNQNGYCYASNGYFADLYACSKQAISKWIKTLESFGYVKISYQGGRGNQQRRVSIAIDSYQLQLRGVSTTVEGVSTGVDHNNTSNNNTSNNKKEEALSENETDSLNSQEEENPSPHSAPPPSQDDVKDFSKFDDEQLAKMGAVGVVRHCLETIEPNWIWQDGDRNPAWTIWNYFGQMFLKMQASGTAPVVKQKVFQVQAIKALFNNLPEWVRSNKLNLHYIAKNLNQIVAQIRAEQSSNNPSPQASANRHQSDWKPEEWKPGKKTQ